MMLYLILFGCSVASMVGALIIIILLLKYRQDKVMKASSPPLLVLMLIGATVLYSEAVIGWLTASRITCMARPWIRHIGFALAYGALILKTWRISVIMRMIKAKISHTRDAQLFRGVAILILISGAYMLIWTLTDPSQPQLLLGDHGNHSDAVKATTVTRGDMICVTPWWDHVISAGELGFLTWGATLCYHARNAPNIYNDTQSLSFAIWNEALWIIFYMFASYMLSLHPDISMTYLLCFIRVQCTITVTLLLIFVPKFKCVFSSLRKLHGTVTEVYGARRVHRLSLLMSKSGAIKTIYCVSCGPLTYTEQHEEETPDSVSEANDSNRENQYTKAEVDSLIELVSNLKKEKSMYKTQVNRLYNLHKDHKLGYPISGLPVYLVAETPEEQNLPQISTQPCMNGRHTSDNQLTGVNGLQIHDALEPYTTICESAQRASWRDLSSTSAYSSCRTSESPDATDDGRIQVFVNSGDTLQVGEDNYGCDEMSHSRKASTVMTDLSCTPDPEEGTRLLGVDVVDYTSSEHVKHYINNHGVASSISDYFSNEEYQLHDFAEEEAKAGQTFLTTNLDIQSTDDKSEPVSVLGGSRENVHNNGIGGSIHQKDCDQEVQQYTANMSGKIPNKCKSAKGRDDTKCQEPILLHDMTRKCQCSVV